MKTMRETLLVLSMSICIAYGAIANADQSASHPNHAAAADILMLGFQDLTQVYGTADYIRCPVGQKIIRAGKVTPGAGSFLSQLTCEILKLTAGCEPWTNQGTGRAAAFETFVDEPASVTRHRLAALARPFDKDAVLTGYIYRYQQRIGSAYGVDRPASVAFSLHLIGASDGRIVWQAWIDETQQALSEDLFKINKFIKRKGKWITANELARSNLEKALSSYMEKK